jgi:glutathione S-transferase
LTDNAGIAIYLEETYPEPPLLGTSPLEKAEIATWQSKVESGFGMAVAHALRNGNPAMKGRALPGPHDYAQIPELSARGLAQIDNFMDLLETHLEGRDFIATDQLSIADITAACTLDFARVVRKKADPERHPNILRWRAGLAQRPSFNL